MRLEATAAFVMGIGFVLLVSCSRPESPPSLGASLRSLLEQSVAEAGSRQGVVLHVDSPRLGLEWEQAAGLADPGSAEAMTPAHPVRIASNTKTFVAAAVLRLVEDGRLGLDDPIDELLPADLVSLLVDGGSRPDAITVRHLLTHTSGLDDHGNDRYAARIMADPQHRWSRAEQLRICVEEGEPQGEPGEVYRYSDTGYVLLGEILEQRTGRSLAGAVWELLDRDGLGLQSTWFETLEPVPANARVQARQFYGSVDISDFDPSFDLWGGGGIVATVGDLATFTRALFTGDVFRRPATLDVMLSTLDGLRSAGGADETSLPPGAYRMGVWVVEHDGLTLYRHTGFWCTSATYVPELDLVVTATANQHEAKELLAALVDGAVDLIAGSVAARQP